MMRTPASLERLWPPAPQLQVGTDLLSGTWRREPARPCPLATLPLPAWGPSALPRSTPFPGPGFSFLLRMDFAKCWRQEASGKQPSCFWCLGQTRSPAGLCCATPLEAGGGGCLGEPGGRRPGTRPSGTTFQNSSLLPSPGC